MKLSKTLNRCYMKARLPFGRATARLRPLPDFLVIGAMKCGTSSLLHYLSHHPRIKTACIKEVHYFLRNYKKGELWYRSYFPPSLSDHRTWITGEATPGYIFFPHAAEKILNLLPEAKLICLFRNPTDRAISHYFHMVRTGREHLPVFEAMQAEESRIASEWDKMLRDPSYHSRHCVSFTYKKRGLYLEQLQRFWQRFPREQLLVLESESFFQNPASTLDRIFQFLEIGPYDKRHEYLPLNVGRNKTDVDPDVYEYLDEYFAPHNKEFNRVTGCNFHW